MTSDRQETESLKHGGARSMTHSHTSLFIVNASGFVLLLLHKTLADTHLIEKS